MTEPGSRCVYGPVPSRRLGHSLGINNIPAKVCPYSCVYCQAGRTLEMRIERRAYHEPEEILRNVRAKMEKAKEAGEVIDYLTFVPDGEPTLDANLGQEIGLLKSLGVPIGVIANSSLLWRDDVREELREADWVSLKVDTTQEKTWRQIDRPHKALRLAPILEGMLKFAGTFAGKLVTETMLVKGLNDGDRCIREIADFLGQLQPEVAYLSIPTRPPAEEWVCGPDEATLNRICHILDDTVNRTEFLVGYEGDAFAFTGDVEEDLLSITAVHPMREEAVDVLLQRAGVGWAMIHRLVAQGDILETEYGGHKFYLRRFRKPIQDRTKPGRTEA